MDDMLPSSGEEYLRMVRAQARKCPAVVVASGAGAQKHLAAKNTSRKYRTDWQSCLPAPEGCAPTVEWRDQFMQDFGAARASLKRFKQSQERQVKRGGARSSQDKATASASAVQPSLEQGGHEAIENDEQQHIIPELNNTQPPPTASSQSPRPVALPNMYDEHKWRTLLYGPTTSPSARGHHSVASTTTDSTTDSTTEAVNISVPSPATTTDAIASIATVTTTTTMAHATTTTTANSFRQEGMPPSPQFLIRLDQGHLIQLLRYHLRWLAEDDLQEQEGRWLYALFLKLDPLVESDQVAVLRNMAKKCARIRSHFNNDSGSKLATVNMVITIVARLFGQEDLE